MVSDGGCSPRLWLHSYTWFLWGHPYGFINFISEALFVGIFLKRGRRNLLGLDGLFWLLLGHASGLACTTASSCTWMPPPPPSSCSSRPSTASLTPCWSAWPFAICLSANFSSVPTFYRISPSGSLYLTLLVMMVLFPAVLLTMLETRQEKEKLEAGVMAELQSLSANVQFHLHSWFQHHLQAVQELADLAGQFPP